MYQPDGIDHELYNAGKYIKQLEREINKMNETRTVTTTVTDDRITEIEVTNPDDITCGECHKRWSLCECLHPPYLKSEREED